MTRPEPSVVTATVTVEVKGTTVTLTRSTPVGGPARLPTSDITEALVVELATDVASAIGALHDST